MPRWLDGAVFLHSHEAGPCSSSSPKRCRVRYRLTDTNVLELNFVCFKRATDVMQSKACVKAAFPWSSTGELCGVCHKLTHLGRLCVNPDCRRNAPDVRKLGGYYVLYLEDGVTPMAQPKIAYNHSDIHRGCIHELHELGNVGLVVDYAAYVVLPKLKGRWYNKKRYLSLTAHLNA